MVSEYSQNAFYAKYLVKSNPQSLRETFVMRRHKDGDDSDFLRHTALWRERWEVEDSTYGTSLNDDAAPVAIQMVSPKAVVLSDRAVDE